VLTRGVDRALLDVRSMPLRLVWKTFEGRAIGVVVVSLGQGQRYELGIRASTSGGDHEVLLAVM